MSQHAIDVTINGREHSVEVESRLLLVHLLRDELGYTGTNVGCETGLCGACTVLMDGNAVKSCCLFGVRADGSEITTVEGLAEGDELHPIQRSFQEEHGLQCGYCTPGMMMTSVDFLQDADDPDRDEIRDALKGNLCRCTGYQNIVTAVSEAADEIEGTPPETRADTE